MPSAKRVEWPGKPVLEKLVWQKPLIHAAAEIGVSDVALKKHRLKLGIELPPPVIGQDSSEFGEIGQPATGKAILCRMKPGIYHHSEIRRDPGRLASTWLWMTKIPTHY